MREIKFRFWYQENKTMSPPATLEQLMQLGVKHMLPTINFLDSKCPIMQYTGIKDKNGTDVYEGDLVKIHGEVHEVVYCGDRDYPAFDVKPETGADSNGLSYAKSDADDFEVIGNIYSNPELLK